MYIIWTISYALVNGFVNAAYAGFTLEATGQGAAASKFELYSSSAYLPMYLMLWVSGLSYTKWGAPGMLNMEAVFAVMAALVFVTAVVLVKRMKSVSENDIPVFVEV
jgi:hypothetical protein